MAKATNAIIRELLDAAFEEDIGAGDVTSNFVIPKTATGEYLIKAREDMVFCGVNVIKEGFGALVKFCGVADGEHLKDGEMIASIQGNVREILAKERVVLNLIQHLSGIATETGKYVEAIKGTKAKILDTRKTTPGLRSLQKYAVKCGGGENHRMGLYDMVLIKDNHILAAGGITKAIEQAKGSKLRIEVECDNLDQVKEALAAGADIIMADNMIIIELKKAVKLAKGKAPIEASGNINLKTVKAVAKTGVDFISTSKITMSARAVDIGLDQI